MIIETQEDVTRAVLAEMVRTPDPRTKEVLAMLVRHLHAFVREARLTEREFQAAIALVNAIGQKTTASHNEAMLVAGALGVSNLICLTNNRNPTQANNLGPFYREGAPRCEDGASLLRSPTPGPALLFKGYVLDEKGDPVAGAEVDVWHSSTVGLYENQDPTQADMNLRGRFTTGADGSFSFRTVKPAGYPVPKDGPAGALLAAQGRHNMRPAHLHFLVFKPGFKTIASQVYDPGDPHLETDSQFGVTRALIGDYAKRADGSYALEFTFVVEPGEARRPAAPITGKAAARSHPRLTSAGGYVTARATRRVVTGHRADGRSTVLFDGPAPNVKQRKAGNASTLLWVTDSCPAQVSADIDRAQREIGVPPPRRGSIFRLAEFPPGLETAPLDNETLLRDFGIGEDVLRGHPPRDPAIHRTRSLDYVVVLEGEIALLLDDSELTLRAGDVVIQQGTNHAWFNRGPSVCRLAMVFIDAEEPAVLTGRP